MFDDDLHDLMVRKLAYMYSEEPSKYEDFMKRLEELKKESSYE